MAVKTIEDRVKALELNLRNLNVFVIKYKNIIETLNKAHPELPVDGAGEIPDNAEVPVATDPLPDVSPTQAPGSNAPNDARTGTTAVPGAF